MKYKIALQHTEEGYSVSVPGLPGCWSQGETEEEALSNIQIAVKEYLEAREELLQDAEIREIEIAD
jgi:predicted RNase H-like HicB family nuclease